MTPDVSLKIRDPGLGIVPANAGRVQVKAGVSSKAIPNVLLGLGGVNPAKTALGSGPLLDCLVQALDVGGGPVLALPLLPSSQGSVDASLALTGAGTGTIGAGKGPENVIKVKVILGGALGTATFKVAIGSGAYGPTVTTGTPGPWSYQVPGAYFDTLVFAAGTYVADDVYTLNLDGTVSRTGTGTATLLNGSTHSPVDSYAILVAITTGGALGVGAFTYSLDNGQTNSAPIGIPASGTYVIPGSGIVLTFAGTFTAGDQYAGNATGPGYTTTDVNNAMTALLANSAQWGWMHLIGKTASAAAAFTMAAVVDAQLTAAETAFRYGFAIIESPQTESDATISTAATNASFVSSRIGIAVGDSDLASRATGRIDKRSIAWAFTARLGAIKLSTDPARFADGPLRNVRGIYRDEAATPGLDDARFITARTFVGVPGYFVTNFRLMAAPGSDFTFGMNRRVMDRACVLTRLGYLEFLNDDVVVDKTTGLIDEGQAQRVDGMVTSELEELQRDQEVSSVSSSLSRDDNLLSSSEAHAEVDIIPKAYLKKISVTIGFSNPFLQAAA